jgi:hypothetical protein
VHFHAFANIQHFLEKTMQYSEKVLPFTILQASGGDRHLGEPVPEIFLFANVAAV